jgi:hypothetical protein
LIKALSFISGHRRNLLVNCLLLYIHKFLTLRILVMVRAKKLWNPLFSFLIVILKDDYLLWWRRFYRVVLWLWLLVLLLGWNICIFLFLGHLELIVKVIIDGSSIVLIQQISHAVRAPALHFSLIITRILI